MVHEKQTTIHNDTGLPFTSIMQQFKYYHEKLHKADEALHYKIGRRCANIRLKPRLLRDILLESKEDISD